MLKKSLVAMVVTIAALVTPSAQATIVEFQFRSTIRLFDPAPIPGLAVGDPVSVQILADNGGAGVASQSWSISDLLLGTLFSRTYFQLFYDGWYSAPAHVAFVTDGSGNVQSSDFYGTTYSVNHQDSFGTGGQIYLYANAFKDFNGNVAYMANTMADSTRWSVAVVPEPSTYALMLAGLGALALAVRRRKT